MFERILKGKHKKDENKDQGTKPNPIFTCITLCAASLRPVRFLHFDAALGTIA